MEYEDYSLGKEYGLTYRQELFCLYYWKENNATKAYQEAYNCSYRVANVNGNRLIKKPKIIGYYERYKTTTAIRLLGATDKRIEYIEWLDSIFITKYHATKKWQPD